MMLLISLGDLMVGLYLIAISVANVLYKERYCQDRFLWLTSGYCALMGAVSSIGSQISLFAMVVLSLSRVFIVGRMRPGSVNHKLTPVQKFIPLVTAALSVLTLSTVISYIPLMEAMDDFFVNGLSYDRDIKLFIGAPSKVEHIAILEKYYSKFRGNTALPWSTVRRLVRNMFSQTYGGVNSMRLHFYGNDGVCLFKYFVTPSDPQAYYSLTVLLINFLCFLIITGSYTSIYLKSSSSSRRLTGDTTRSRKSREREAALQKKLAFIITTDFFCWIPFILISGLHYLMIFDASPWYATFSILILPINSVINPLVYSSYVVSTFTLLKDFLYESVRMKIQPDPIQRRPVNTDEETRT
jgi:hypothetical protein